MGPAPSSTSPSPDALVGVDPDYTEELAYGPAVVVIGPTAAGAWERLELQAMLANQDATRRAVRKLAALGIEPEAEVRRVGPIIITALMAEMGLDPVFKEELRCVSLEAVRLSVRGHMGFAFADGTPRPFSVTREKLRGRPVDVVGEATMRFYEANPGLVDAIWSALKRLNRFEEPEKKASPR